MAGNSPYDLLGVKPDADEAAIKAAYRALAKQHHPDHNRSDPQAEAKFKAVGAAYDVLKDPARRRQYDRVNAARRATRAAPKQPQPDVQAAWDQAIQRNAEMRRKKSEADRAAAHARDLENQEKARKAESAKSEVRMDIFQHILAGYSDDPKTSYQGDARQYSNALDRTTHRQYEQFLRDCFASPSESKLQTLIDQHQSMVQVGDRLTQGQSEAISVRYGNRMRAHIKAVTAILAADKQAALDLATRVSDALAQLQMQESASDELTKSLDYLSAMRAPLSFLDNVQAYLARPDIKYRKLTDLILDADEYLINLQRITPIVGSCAQSWTAFKGSIAAASIHDTKSVTDKIRDLLFAATDKQNGDPEPLLGQVRGVLRDELTGTRSKTGAFGGNKIRAAALVAAENLLPDLVRYAAEMKSLWPHADALGAFHRQIDAAALKISDLKRKRRILRANQKPAVAADMVDLNLRDMKEWLGLLKAPGAKTESLLSSPVRKVLRALLASAQSGQPVKDFIDLSELQKLSAPQHVEAETARFKKFCAEAANKAAKPAKRNIAIDRNEMARHVKLLSDLSTPTGMEDLGLWRRAIKIAQDCADTMGARYSLMLQPVDANTETTRPKAGAAAYSRQTADAS